MDFSQDEFFGSRDIQDLIVFRLMQAVEVSIDIATHIVAGMDLPRRETAGDIFELLGERKIISKRAAKTMIKATGFRNILAHEYKKPRFDVKQVLKDYKTDVRDLKLFMAEVMELLEKNK